MGYLAASTIAKDPWEKNLIEISFKRVKSYFGSGCKNDWPWFFEGSSVVEVSSLKDVFDWLHGCEYIGDQELFNESDFWQHPVTFENLRKGDCEDHAPWAWRKLVEMGVPAEFVVGRMKSESDSRHAWVMYEKGGETLLLEATCGSVSNKSIPSPI